MPQARKAFDGTHDFLRRRKCVDVPAAACQPAVEPVRQCRRVRHRNEQASARSENPPDLPQRAFQVVKMFQAMVCDDGGERTIGKREFAGIATNKTDAVGAAGCVKVEPDNRGRGAVFCEAALAAAKVENEGPAGQTAQELMHLRILVHRRDAALAKSDVTPSGAESRRSRPRTVPPKWQWRALSCVPGALHRGRAVCRRRHYSGNRGTWCRSGIPRILGFLLPRPQYRA